MTLTVITPPGEAALSLDSAKDYLRIGHTGDDQLVSDLIEAATAQLEQIYGLVLISQQRRLTISSWPVALGGGGMRLRIQPVQSLVSVRVIDSESGEVDETSRFQIIDDCLVLQPWSIAPIIPLGGVVEIDFQAGYGGGADVPANLKLALLMLIQASFPGGVPLRSAEVMDAKISNLVAPYQRVRL